MMNKKIHRRHGSIIKQETFKFNLINSEFRSQLFVKRPRTKCEQKTSVFPASGLRLIPQSCPYRVNQSH